MTAPHDLFALDVLSMHLLPQPYPPSFALVDPSNRPVGSVRTPAVPGWRQLLGVLHPLRSGAPAVFTLTDVHDAPVALIERTSGGTSGPDAVITTPAGEPVATSEARGLAFRTYRVVAPDRTVLATIEGVPTDSRILDSSGTPRGDIGYEPPRHRLGDVPAHDTYSFHFRFDPTTPVAVRLGCLAAMVVHQTAPVS